MDHRWDDSTWRDHATRGERERYDASRIADDPDVERRDRDRLTIEAEQRLQRINRSPWDIGVSFYDQRDLYTCNAKIDEAGYGRGPSRHPEEGSYASPRRAPSNGDSSHQRYVGDASIYEREAWPWLNYHDVADDPFFGKLVARAHAHEQGLWQRIKRQAINITERTFRMIPPGPNAKNANNNAPRSDDRINQDVADAFASREDLDATDIQVSIQHAEVTLEGTVQDRRSKRIAEEVVEGVRGVLDVHNRLTIRHDDPTDADVAFVLPLASLVT